MQQGGKKKKVRAWIQPICKGITQCNIAVIKIACDNKMEKEDLAKSEICDYVKVKKKMQTSNTVNFILLTESCFPGIEPLV